MKDARQAELERRVLYGLVAAAALGAALLLLGLLVDPERVAYSYLAAFVYWLSIALGALLLVMIHHVTNSTWFIVLRRLAENAALFLLPLALLFLPLLLWRGVLFPWVSPDALAEPHLRELAHAREAYLNVPFFTARAALYFSIWIAVSQLLWLWSIGQHTGDGVRLAQRLRTLSAAALLPVGFALTFASFDWLMSLSSEFSSDIFGVYFFAGSVVGALGYLTIVAHLSRRAGRLEGIGVSHYYALGKLLLTFVIFWSYIAFSQFYLVWIADIPVEASWYAERAEHGWYAVSLLLIAGHFALPFVVLLSREIKRHSARLAAVGAWMMMVHYLDVYWMVLPALHRGFLPSWLDAAALMAIGGAVLAFASWRLRHHREVASGDPRFESSLNFVTQ